MTNNTLHIYTRVSTHTQRDEGTSLTSQQELGIKRAEDLGFSYRIWNEGGASSNYEDFTNRPVLLELLSEIDKSSIQHLWVYNNDRLSRNYVTAQAIRVKLQKNYVTLYTNTGQFDLNDPQDQFLKTVLDGFAQLDNAQRTERTRLGKLSRVKQGGWMGGPPPFGYKIEKKKLVVNDDESIWVEKMYQWYVEGKSTEFIKSQLDKAGVETRRKKGIWSLGSIQKILQNTHPIGYYTYVDSTTGEIVKCVCPSIVSQTLWNECQKKRELIKVRKGQKNRTTRFYMLRDLLYCGHCGHHMSGRIKETKKEFLYYCPRKERNWKKSAPLQAEKWKRGKGCGMIRSLNIPLTDKLVMNEIGNYKVFDLVKENFSNQALRDYNEDSDDIKIKKLSNLNKKLSKELDNAEQNIADVQTAKILKKQNEKIADKIIKNLEDYVIQVRQKIEKIRIELNSLKHDDFFYLNNQKVFNEFETMWCNIEPLNGKTPEEQRGFLQSIIEKIDVFYDSDKSEHKLIATMKMPIGRKQEVMINSKKKRENATPVLNKSVTVE